MQDLADLDNCLRPLTQSFSRCAEDLLELREALQKRRHPGRSVTCYFKLFGLANPSQRPSLRLLRRLLEQTVEIVACDQTRNVLETIPLRLEEDDLEGLCYRVIEEMQMDRAYAVPKLFLRFRYKTEPADRLAG